MGAAIDSIVSPGCIVSGGRVIRSVLSPGVRVNSYSDVENSILLEGVHVGRYSRIRSAIVDAGVRLPEGLEIGLDDDADRERGITISENGIRVISQTVEQSLAASV